MSKLSLLLLASAPLFAQLESHTISISATRSVNLQPDQVVFGLSVGATGSSSLDQIVRALSSVGVTSANFAGVGSSSSLALQWSFTLIAPLSDLSATISSLMKLQQTIAQNDSGLTLTFAIDGTQVSEQLQQSQLCSDADLITDAIAQAQKLASAAEFTLGPIVRLSTTPADEIYAIPNNFDRLGSFVSSGLLDFGGFSDFLFASAPAPVTCSLAVKFQLLP
jgi:hypothetical protein